jgi:hypothetical protein
LLGNSKGCFREIALFPILLFFRFALRFGHVESCHRSTLREILKFKLTHYRILAYPTRHPAINHRIMLYFLPFRGGSGQKAAYRELCRIIWVFGSAMIRA